MNFNPKILIILAVALFGGCWAVSRLATTDMQEVASQNSTIDAELYPTPDISRLNGVFGVGDGQAVGQGFPATNTPSMQCQYVGRDSNTFSFGRTPTGMNVVYKGHFFDCFVEGIDETNLVQN